jgi:hypothetical protein
MLPRALVAEEEYLGRDVTNEVAASKFLMDNDKARFFAHYADIIRAHLYAPPYIPPPRVDSTPNIFGVHVVSSLFPACLEMLCILFDHHVGSGNTLGMKSVAIDAYQQLEMIPATNVSPSAKHRYYSLTSLSPLSLLFANLGIVRNSSRYHPSFVSICSILISLSVPHFHCN